MAIQNAAQTLMRIKQSNPDLVTIISRSLNLELQNCKMLPFSMDLNIPSDLRENSLRNNYTTILRLLLNEAGYVHITNFNNRQSVSEIEKYNKGIVSVKVIDFRLN